MDLNRIFNKKVLLYVEFKTRGFVKEVRKPVKKGPCLYGSLAVGD